MQRKLTPLVLAAGLTLAGCVDESTTPTEPWLDPAAPSLASQPAAATNHQLVIFSGDAIPGDFAGRVAQLGGRVVKTYPAVGVALIAGVDEDGLESLDDRSDVESVVPDEIIPLAEPVRMENALASGASGRNRVDPTQAGLYDMQWNMRTIGAERAWAAGRTGKGIRIAILDTGLDDQHLDLVGRVDTRRSASMVAGDPRYYEDELLAEYAPGAPAWVDLHYHGTHVGATVASNATVAAGMTSGATLMAVKVLGHYIDGSVIRNGAYTSTVLDGITYAVDRGANIINMSLGGFFDRAVYPETFRAVEKTLNYALRRNVLVVVAAGNGGEDGIGDDINGNGTIYDTYCESLQVMCVTATGPSSSVDFEYGPWNDVDAFAGYSNYGMFAVSVAAPGGNDGGVIWAACSGYSLYVDCSDRSQGWVLGLSGTSMATPHVSGLAALVMERNGKNAFGARLQISARADDRGARGRDPYYGWGRINVPRTLGLR